MKRLIQILIGVGVWMLAGVASAHAQTPCTGDGLNTAIGCIENTTTSGIATAMIRLLIGSGLGIGVIRGGWGFWLYRNGDGPEAKEKAGKILLDTFSGIVFIFLSISILKFIGIDILKLDALTGGQLSTILGP